MPVRGRADNLTRNAPLATSLEVATSFWGKFMGLMGRPSLPPSVYFRLMLIGYFGLEWLYPIVFELLPGSATPGKRVRMTMVVR